MPVAVELQHPKKTSTGIPPPPPPSPASTEALLERVNELKQKKKAVAITFHTGQPDNEPPASQILAEKLHALLFQVASLDDQIAGICLELETRIMEKEVKEKHLQHLKCHWHSLNKSLSKTDKDLESSRAALKALKRKSYEKRTQIY